MPRTRYRFGDFELDPASRELWRGGARLALPPKSFECLAYLIAHRDRAVGRDELISAVWGRVDASDTLVAQTLLRARKALDDSGERQAMIRTVPRFGYRWVAPVQEIAQAQLPPVSDIVAASPADSAEPATAVPELAPPPAALPSRPRWLVATLVGLALLLVTSLLWLGMGARAPQPAKDANALALILPVRVSPNDAETSWVRLGAMDYIANRVRRSGLKVVPSEQTLHIGGQVDDTTLHDPATWQQLQADSGARWVLAPEASRDGDGWRVHLQWREGAQERMVEARGATPLAAAAIATDTWLHRQGRRSRQDTPTPLTERVQQIDAELSAGQLAAVRRLIDTAPVAQGEAPALRVRKAQLAFRSGQIDQAEQQFLQLLGAGPDAIDADTRARVLMGLGAVGIRRHNFVDAQARYTQALALLQDDSEGLDDPSMLGNAYNGRGVARIEQQQMEAGVQDLGMARIAMQRAGDLVEAAMVGTNLGMLENRRGHHPQALQEFDRAIATYERFGVRDYLAAALSAKAETQLALAQPDAALETISRAQVNAIAVEDTTLATRVEAVRARVQIENGRLRDADATLAHLQALGVPPDAQTWRALSLRLALARGDVQAAVALARQFPDSPAPPTEMTLLRTQAALRATDAALADRLQALLATPAPGDETDADALIAQALLAARDGAGLAHALALLDSPAAEAMRATSPDNRVRLGVTQARLLLAAGRAQDAAALLGSDLAGYASSDYRVAWSMEALYRELGDGVQRERARIQADALRGERPPRVPPVL